MLSSNRGVKSILKNGAFLASSAWIEVFARAIYLIFITRILGPESYGIWAYVLATYGIAVGLVSFGAEQLLPIKIGTKKPGLDRSVSSALGLRIALQTVAAICLILFAVGYEPAGLTRSALLLTVPAFLGRAMFIWSSAVFVGYERIGILVKYSMVLRGIEVLLGIGILLMGGGLISIIILHSIIWFLQGGISLALIRRNLIPLRLVIDFSDWILLLKSGTALGIAAASMSWLMAGPLIMMRQAGVELHMIGQIAFALQISALMLASTQPFLNAALPILSRSHSDGDRRIEKYGYLTLATSVGGSLIVAVLAMKIGPPIVIMTIGPSFSVASELLGLSVLIAAITLLPAGYGQYLLVHGSKWHGVIAGAFGVIVLYFAMSWVMQDFTATKLMLGIISAWLVRGVVICVIGIRKIHQQDQLNARG